MSGQMREEDGLADERRGWLCRDIVGGRDRVIEYMNKSWT